MARGLLFVTALVAVLGVAAAADSFATCAEALQKTPGYNLTTAALANCPDLQKLQDDPKAAMTYFVPSDAAIKSLAEFVGLPVKAVVGPQFKGIMCSFMKYHVVDGKVPKKDWTVGQTLTTRHGASLTVTSLGEFPTIKTATGGTATVRRVLQCGSAVAFGTDAVLTPFKVPKLSIPGFGGGGGSKVAASSKTSSSKTSSKAQ